MTDNDKVPELTNGEFEEFVKEGVVLVDFFADWCMPCLMMAPIIDELSEKMGGKAKVGKVNVEDNQEIASKFGVSSIPSIFILRDGKVMENIVGARSVEELEEKLNKYL